MSACDDYIQKLKTTLPEQCSVEDLLKIGLFTSHQTARRARATGDTPSYFKLTHRILYPREAVIEWLENRKHEGTYANSQTNKAQGCCKNTSGEARVA